MLKKWLMFELAKKLLFVAMIKTRASPVPDIKQLVQLYLKLQIIIELLHWNGT